ncbi:hypothetical protein [Novosphingobium sp. B1]|uniref:hypothetical protein n=1 Tax=Novosphingobium sp. B1 TaxID=1938756 RepID=UPI0009D81D11|nr:hypothetical protein [Novosphingobium sp. B1]SMC90938.1 hypothetical protein SAMN06272759_11116 [Novosphingobium sp. B1]
MTDQDRLRSAKALRDEALAVFKGDVELARIEVSPRRIKERAVGEASEIIDTARDVATDNKAILGATVAALLAWLFRQPIQDLVDKALDRIR